MPDFEVITLPEVDHIKEGDTAPDFTCPLVNEEFWENVRLSDLTNKDPVLLVFYTMDGAFPATYIWNELRDRAWDEEYDIIIVGLSISSPYEHKTLIKERKINYKLFSDPQNRIAEEYGISYELDGMAGINEPRPAVFLLDNDRTVKYAWVANKWPDFPNYDEIELQLKEF